MDLKSSALTQVFNNFLIFPNRYEKMPVDFFQVVPHDPFVGQNNNIQMKRPSASPGQSDFLPYTQYHFVLFLWFSPSTGTQWSTLSHYLHHRRWIWCIQGSPGLALSLNSVARILSIITKMRLQEGFSFAHSSSGIFTFLLEVDMEVNRLVKLWSFQFVF